MPKLAVTGPQELGQGVWPDLQNDLSPLLVDSSNIVFEAGRAMPAPGQQLVLASGKPKPIRALLSQVNWSRTSIFFANPDGIYEWDGGSLSTRYTGSIDYCTLAPWGNFTLAVEGGKLLAKTAEAGPFERVADSPETLGFLSIWSPYVFVYQSKEVFWCALDDIQTWTPTVDNDARSLPIRDMDSPIRCVLPSATGAWIFSADGLWQLSYVGPDNYFGVRKILTGIGCFGRFSATRVGNILYGLGPSGIWRTDGSSIQFLDNPAMREEFFQNRLPAGQDLRRRCTVWHDASNERLVFSYINKISGRFEALNYSIKYQNWAPLASGYTATDHGNSGRFRCWAAKLGNIFGQSKADIAANQVVPTGLRFSTRMEVRLGYGQELYGHTLYGGVIIDPKDDGLGSTADMRIYYTLNGVTQQYTALIDEVTTTAWFETKDLDFGDDVEEKYIDEINVKLTNAATAGSLVLQYALKNRLNDPLVWSDPFSLAEADAPIFPRVTTRYMRVRITDSFTKERWQCSQISYHGSVGVGGRS